MKRVPIPRNLKLYKSLFLINFMEEENKTSKEEEDVLEKKAEELEEDRD